MKSRSVFVALIVAMAGALLAAAPSAMACSPSSTPPLPPAPQLALGASAEDVVSNQRAWMEANAAWERIIDEAVEADEQAGLLGRTDSLVLVRLDSVGRTNGTDFPQPNLPKVTLKPLRWLTGQGPLTEFQLVFTQITSCGPERSRDAWAGAPGDVLLVYLSGDRLHQDNVLDTIAVKRIVEPRALEALTWSDERQ